MYHWFTALIASDSQNRVYLCIQIVLVHMRNLQVKSFLSGLVKNFRPMLRDLSVQWIHSNGLLQLISL